MSSEIALGPKRSPTCLNVVLEALPRGVFPATSTESACSLYLGQAYLMNHCKVCLTDILALLGVNHNDRQLSNAPDPNAANDSKLASWQQGSFGNSARLNFKTEGIMPSTFGPNQFTQLLGHLS